MASGSSREVTIGFHLEPLRVDLSGGGGRGAADFPSLAQVAEVPIRATKPADRELWENLS
jgi:hypothetical protein